MRVKPLLWGGTRTDSPVWFCLYSLNSFVASFPWGFPHPRRGTTITVALSSDPIFSANDRTRFAPSAGVGANLIRSFTSSWDTSDDIPSDVRTMCEYSEPESRSHGQKTSGKSGGEQGRGLPLRSLSRTSGSGVTPNGLYLKSPKLLVFSSTPIHRPSPKESVTSAEPITRRNRVDSTGVSAWCLVVIGVTVPSVPHMLTVVSLLWSTHKRPMRGENRKRRTRRGQQ